MGQQVSYCRTLDTLLIQSGAEITLIVPARARTWYNISIQAASLL